MYKRPSPMTDCIRYPSPHELAWANTYSLTNSSRHTRSQSILTPYVTAAHKRLRRRLANSLRWKQRRRRFQTVISYLDIEASQFDSELETYLTSSASPLRDIHETLGWELSHITKRIASMSLSDAST
ncbi:hypothetical protein R3P38DRAFT_2987042 [Favolaschia claudopus]|uniref:Uncharacterized protein n=1 Tax=Favolaschia claudopus TaxID=2862362 RepID=A0AAW0AV50_9AGAR